MPVKFKLINRQNFGKDAGQVPRKVYAQAINNGYTTFEELCADITENCTLTSADVKAVMDRMNFTLDKHLRAGRIVQFGEIGNFRMAVGSSGAVDEKDFSTAQIRTPRIVFTPGKRLQTARSLTTFEKEAVNVVEQSCERPHAD
ncbi:MAG: DNA-binding protein [Tannerellaceae bacterium]|jgi:predicted histone-like DNA-binding protein|nr:DNA-binding protein [Tannerellaceae bacterium]